MRAMPGEYTEIPCNMPMASMASVARSPFLDVLVHIRDAIVC